MDPAQAFEAYKNKIGARIAYTLGQGMIDGKITEEEGRDIANYILGKVDEAKNSGQLMDFLTDLASKWPIFDSILTTELSKITDRKDDAVVQKAEGLIQENKIDEALEMVKSAAQKNSGGNS